MKYLFTFLLAALPGVAAAQDIETPVAVNSTPPLLLTIVVLASAVACVVFCIQVLMLVRGGQLSRSWLVFTIGFGVLALSQIIVILVGFGVIPANRYLMPVLMMLMSAFFAYGLYDTKRVLG
ncbi:hypothetical protein C3F09_05940 [candidate division GN15 bacterium]|uniref:Uncharacterized protein n=1 Tax=candidate division GN15 bacterium TaxID=2072418 RepID=A0A855X850_9BACT|nr:MAG: hypothetical protein C3F09_05940 [candidate division GN15 bacterium]